MGPHQVRQDMLRHSVPWRDLPQYGTLRTPMIVRAARGHQPVARGAILKKGNGIRVMAMVVDFKTDKPHSFERVEERVHDRGVGAQRARMGQRAYPSGLGDQSKSLLRSQRCLGDIAGNEKVFKRVLDTTGVATSHEGVRQVGTGQRAAGALQDALLVQRSLPVLLQEGIDALQHLDTTLQAVLLRLRKPCLQGGMRRIEKVA